jgi:hypothetical protein
MAENNNSQRTGNQQDQDTAQSQSQSIGNQQGTAQTGAQNNGGQNRTEQDDEFTEDLRNSGDRKARGGEEGS